MTANATTPSIERTTSILAWLEDYPHLEVQSLDIDESRAKVVFKESSEDEFRRVFSGREAKFNRGSYGFSWLTVVDGTTTYECRLPKLPDSETVTL